MHTSTEWDEQQKLFHTYDAVSYTHLDVYKRQPGPGSGKMATCLSQLYHEHKRGIKAGYAKFETFPIWNLPLKQDVYKRQETNCAEDTPL